MKTVLSPHPFPARMAPEIVLKKLGAPGTAPLTVLDPMCGSGTTLVHARLAGNCAIGVDSDPLARMLSDVWNSSVPKDRVRAHAEKVLERAMGLYVNTDPEDAYPKSADRETRAFIDYWFDPDAKRQLSGLSTAISRVRDRLHRNVFWCAFSRLIIVKKAGASLAMDIAHSRPHKVFEVAPIRPFDKFLASVELVLSRMPFDSDTPEASRSYSVLDGDARSLPVAKKSIDVIVTSPPYLNAIDYLRAHRMSLVWMGFTMASLRHLRGTNIGTEKQAEIDSKACEAAYSRIGNVNGLPGRTRGMLARYVNDMNNVVKEFGRVLKDDGRAIVVIGDCTIRGFYIKNSDAIVALAEAHSFVVTDFDKRPIEERRRYLPPPKRRLGDGAIHNRMRFESIITFEKSA